jgi:hypothetical protein
MNQAVVADISNVIELTPDEIHTAALHGLLRRTQKLAGRRGDRTQQQRSTWDNEVEGACAELAFCKWRGTYWTGLSQIRARDGGGFEVRYTVHDGTGGLIIYEHDIEDCVFVLIDGHAPRFRLVGWLRGRDGKRDEYRTTFGYLVPRDRLHARFHRDGGTSRCTPASE